MSDWEARPLTARQASYAAQDAHVLVRLFDAFHERMPGVAPQVVQAKARSFSAVRYVREGCKWLCAFAAKWRGTATCL